MILDIEVKEADTDTGMWLNVMVGEEGTQFIVLFMFVKANCIFLLLNVISSILYAV